MTPKTANNGLGFICDPSDPTDPIMRRVNEVIKAAEREKAGKRIEYIDNEGVVPLALAILKSHQNLKIWGPTGTGKTTLCEYLAQELGAKYFSVQMTLDTQTFQLLSEPRIFDGETKIAINTITQWLLWDGPAVAAIHEPNMAPGGVNAFMYGLADDQRCVNLPDLGVVLPRGKDKYLIITYNPSEKSEYAGTQAMNIALLRRFEGFFLGYLPQTVELDILKKIGLSYTQADKLCQMATYTRSAYAEGELITPVTLGNLKAWAHLIVDEGLEMEQILTVMLGMYPEAQHGRVREFWAGKVKSTKSK